MLLGKLLSQILVGSRLDRQSASAIVDRHGSFPGLPSDWSAMELVARGDAADAVATVDAQFGLVSLGGISVRFGARSRALFQRTALRRAANIALQWV